MIVVSSAVMVTVSGSTRICALGVMAPVFSGVGIVSPKMKPSPQSFGTHRSSRSMSHDRCSMVGCG